MALPWERSPVPAEDQIRGLGPIVPTVHDLSCTAAVPTEVTNMRARDYAAHGAADRCRHGEARAIWRPNCTRQ